MTDEQRDAARALLATLEADARTIERQSASVSMQIAELRAELGDQPPPISAEVVQYRGELALRLGAAERKTVGWCGEGWERVTTHTTMLGLLMLEVYRAHGDRLGLDLGRLLEHALVHDLVEAICGDTPTLSISDEDRAAKERAEAQALDTIRQRDPAIAAAVDRYEEGKAAGDVHAVLVYVVDKLCARVNHAINTPWAALKAQGVAASALEGLCDAQTSALADKCPQAAFLAPLLDEFRDRSIAAMRRPPTWAWHAACEQPMVGPCGRCLGLKRIASEGWAAEAESHEPPPECGCDECENGSGCKAQRKAEADYNAKPVSEIRLYDFDGKRLWKGPPAHFGTMNPNYSYMERPTSPGSTTVDQVRRLRLMAEPVEGWDDCPTCGADFNMKCLGAEGERCPIDER